MRSNKNAAVFLDRDGTIIEDRGHLRDPSDVVFFSETFDALRKLQEHFHLFIVTNQRGIAEGRITRREANRVNDGIVAALFDRGIKVENVYTCTHRRSDNCRCIKPKPYFLKRAATLYGLDLNGSFTVGDHPHDVQLAKNVGARGVYVLTGHGQKHLPELPEDTEVVTGIMEAAEKIATRYQIERPRRSRKPVETEFTLNLGVACDLWQRPDLGHEPEHAKQVAEVLQKVGIRVHKVSGGWLECEPRPVGIWEALTGRLAKPNWAKQFNYPPERSGQVLKLLSDKGIPVSDC
ncbi:MAG: D-glycero-alpha-D-manno-heptose-1,7-bisphosphate 7-phosphatase [Planctomycetota bacterium]